MNPQAGIGDLESTAKGTAARFNAGKPDFSLIPLRVMAKAMLASEREPTDAQTQTALALAHVGSFQATGNTYWLYLALEALGAEALPNAARVFEYGKKKYASWNWAKGFNWSVPLACIGRHAHKHFYLAEENDDESGHPHQGHLACNILMLLHFAAAYPEGNDLPPPELFKAAAA